jgi:hypothetical protein
VSAIHASAVLQRAAGYPAMLSTAVRILILLCLGGNIVRSSSGGEDIVELVARCHSVATLSGKS